MSEREINLAEIIEKWERRRGELQDPALISGYHPGIKKYLDKINDRVTILHNFFNQQSTQIILPHLEPKELPQIDQALGALSRPIRRQLPPEAILDILGTIFKGLDLIAGEMEKQTFPERQTFVEKQTTDIPVEPPKPALPKASGICIAERAKPAEPRPSYGPYGIDMEVKTTAAAPGKKAPKAARKKPRGPRVVNTGFAPCTTPDKALDPKMPLRAGDQYFFWLEIGPPQKKSIEKTPGNIPEVPAEAILTVVLFGFKDGLIITPGADLGELKVQRDQTVCVTRQPLAESPPPSVRREQRLFFPVAAPAKCGKYRLRCHIYWGQLLLQSRIIRALVREVPQLVTRGQALQSALDYTLSPSLAASRITKFKDQRHDLKHRLSLFMNRNDDGTHSFHLFGTDRQERFKQDDIRFREGELQGMITQARRTLRLASWDSDKEWQEGFSYKYKDRKLDLIRLKSDLTNLACWGHAFYTAVRNRLAGGDAAGEQLEKVMLEPGIVQLAMKEAPSYVLPAALIYDYPLDTGAEKFSLCPSFTTALEQNQPLADLGCFHGHCPSRSDLQTICASGFWGFRHCLGMPLSVAEGPDAPSSIPVQQELHMCMIVATDMKLLSGHSKKLQGLRPRMVWNYADQRDEAFKVMKEFPHLVYFYCHGGLLSGMPYLLVGNKGTIDPSNLYDYKIEWEAPRPLVFINGCNTAALEPLQALEFITPLVTHSHCAGVIGTEITIFEELSTVFAEECLGRFFQGESIGAALRGARLKVLAEGNPLGLVYIPYVMATLTLEDKNGTTLSGLQPAKENKEVVDLGDELLIGDIRLPKHQN